MKDLYDGQTYDLKNKGGYMDEYGCGSSGVWNIQSDISLDDVIFQFITVITFKWDHVIWHSIDLLVWIGL